MSVEKPYPPASLSAAPPARGAVSDQPGSRSPAALISESLTKRFGGVLATDGVSLSITPGSLHALIGPNGVGKTTLIAQLGGQLAPDSGLIALDAHDISKLPPARRVQLGLTRTFQITEVFGASTVLQNVMLAVQARQGHSFRFVSRAGRDRSLIEPAEAALERTGLAERIDEPAASLSHGERRQLEIAMALATEPRVLLLDEPMAGMSRDETERLSELLGSLRGSVSMLLVEHDMDVVFALADTLSVLVAGQLIASGEPGTVRRSALVQQAYLGAPE